MAHIAPTTLLWSRVGGPPLNVSPPTINGQLIVGAIVTVSRGAWTNNPTVFTYQWRANGVVIPGETGTSLLIDADTLGQFLSVTETPFNGAFGLPETSVAVGPVTAPPTPGPSLDFGTPDTAAQNSMYLPAL